MHSTEADGAAEAQFVSLQPQEEIRPGERSSRFGWAGSPWRDYLLLITSLLLIALGLIFGLSGSS
jgi:hypothetical protein